MLFHHPKEVAVRRGDEADVDLDRLRTADPLELLLLQDAQQLRLKLERDLADLVEEQRAAVGHLEAADLLGDGAGEGAPLVPEELALEETGRNRGAVELHERAVAAVASVVDGPREQLLARARFAEKQDRRIGRCDDLHLLERPAQCGTVADDVLERLLVPNLALEVQALFGELVLEAPDLTERHGVLDRDGHELRHLAHELDLGVGVRRVVAPRESECAESRVNGREGEDAEACDTVFTDHRHSLGPSRFSTGVRHDERLLRVDHHRVRRLRRDLLLAGHERGAAGLQPRGPHDAALGVVEHDADEVEPHDPLQLGRQAAEELLGLSTRADRFGDGQQRLESRRQGGAPRGCDGV